MGAEDVGDRQYLAEAQVPSDIALVLPSFGSGGAERVVLNLASGFKALGARVRLIVLDPDGPLRGSVTDGVEVVDLHVPRVRRAARRLIAELRGRPADLLIGSQTHLNLLLALIRPVLPRRTGLVLREPNLLPADARDARQDRLVGWLLGRADLVVASSEAMRDHLVTTVASRSKVRVLPNPVDVDSLRSAAHNGTPLGHVDGLVSVGRLTDQKGYEDLLDALGRVPGDRPLTVLGDGPLRPSLEDRVHRLGLSGRVRFVGRIDERETLTATVARAALLVHPARYDGMPNAVLEALALGTPVLATTDLEVLRGLAAEVGPAALRLVPRAAIAEAIEGSSSATPPLAGGDLRPSLLPKRFDMNGVVHALLDAYEDVRASSGA